MNRRQGAWLAWDRGGSGRGVGRGGSWGKGRVGFGLVELSEVRNDVGCGCGFLLFFDFCWEFWFCLRKS